MYAIASKATLLATLRVLSMIISSVLLLQLLNALITSRGFFPSQMLPLLLLLLLLFFLPIKETFILSHS